MLLLGILRGANMEKIILGILMLRRLTVYEIRGIIKKNFQSMCSDSLGSIQAVIKKLLAEQMITCMEFMEKSVNKKQYSITNAGRAYFLEWLKTPADMSKMKNMELGKLLFMGLIPAEERFSLVNEIILMLENELSELNEIQAAIQESDEKEQAIIYLENDPEYRSGIQNATRNSSVVENANEIGKFEAITLQYGIDSTKFQIDWFKSLKNNLDRELLNG